MNATNPLKDLLDAYGGSSGSSKTINNSEFTSLLKEFDANGDGEFSKSEFTELADAWGISEQNAGKAYDNLTQNGQKDLTLKDFKNLAKDEMKDGSLGLDDLGDLRSRLLGVGGAADPSLPGGAGQGNPGLDTSGINLGNAINGFNSLDTNDSNTVSSSELKSGLDKAAGDNGKLSRKEFQEFSQSKLGLSKADANDAYDLMKEDTGGLQPSAGGALDILGGDGSPQGLGDFLQNISDLRKDARS